MNTYINNKIDLQSGEKFGNWTILKKVENYVSPCKKTYSRYLCRCKCRKEVNVNRNSLISGKSRSCGSGHCRKLYKGVQDLSQTYFHSLQKSAKRRNLQFNITIKYIWDLFLKQNKKCNLSDLTLIFQSTTKKSDGTASLDRIDSTKGYIEGNVQWIHKDINSMKMNLNQEKFIYYCKLLTNKINE